VITNSEFVGKLVPEVVEQVGGQRLEGAHHMRM
jgi:hypothetical protein